MRDCRISAAILGGTVSADGRTYPIHRQANPLKMRDLQRKDGNCSLETEIKNLFVLSNCLPVFLGGFFILIFYFSIDSLIIIIIYLFHFQTKSYDKQIFEHHNDVIFYDDLRGRGNPIFFFFFPRNARRGNPRNKSHFFYFFANCVILRTVVLYEREKPFIAGRLTPAFFIKKPYWTELKNQY